MPIIHKIARNVKNLGEKPQLKSAPKGTFNQDFI